MIYFDQFSLKYLEEDAVMLAIVSPDRTRATK